MIPISTVRIDEEIEHEVLEALRSGMIAQGPRVAELEAMFAKICGVRHAIAVNNGTTALVACLRMLDVKRGSTLITSPFTFVATLNAAIEAGYRVKFADIDHATFNMSPESLESLITDDVSVVMPVHLYGQCADMTRISEIASKNSLQLVEDAAQAHGAKHKEKFAGSFGAGCFSFYATKNVTTGEGGIITTDDDNLADRLRIYRNQGMRVRYQYEMAGTNYRMTDLQAAVGIPQLRRIEHIIDARGKNAQRLTELLSNTEGVTLPIVTPGNSHVWHQYTIRVNRASKRSRDEVLEMLAAEGVGSGIYYPRLVHDYECFSSNKDIERTPTPVAAKTVSEVLSLPVHQFLTDSEIEKIASAVIRAVQSPSQK